MKAFLVCVPVVVFLVAVGGLLSNRALSASASAIEARHWAVAVRDANTAARWAPWSYQPADLSAQAQLAAGNRAAAAREYRRAIALDPADVDAWRGLAQAADGPTRQQALATARGLDPLGP
jgi:Tfp pilus assembly protein PilF